MLPMDVYEPDKRLTLPVSSRDHSRGHSSARITLVQYGDYQCTACPVAHNRIQALQQQLAGQIRFVFRHFPQANLHSHAFHAAEAAEAAASQKKFWQMHTHLLTHQSHLADSDLVEYALYLSLDIEQFLHEMTADCHVVKVQEDIVSGIRSGVKMTPTFFINGVKCNDAIGLTALVEEILKLYRS